MNIKCKARLIILSAVEIPSGLLCTVATTERYEFEMVIPCVNMVRRWGRNQTQNLEMDSVCAEYYMVNRHSQKHMTCARTAIDNHAREENCVLFWSINFDSPY